MKNVLFLLIDGCNADYLGPKDFKPSSSPFLDQLGQKSDVYTNVFSSGPYTEAAMIELMGGYRTLEKHSFIENMKYAPQTIAEAFHDAGYETYSVLLEFAYYDSFMRGVDHPRYYMAPTFNTIWFGRFRFYAEMYLNHNLPETKYQIMYDFMEEYFSSYSTFLKKLVTHSDETAGLENVGYSKMELEEKLKGMADEEQSYHSNPRKYVESLLKQGLTHQLFHLAYGKSWVQTPLMDTVYEKMLQRYAPTIQRMRSLQKNGNRKNIGGFLPNALKAGGRIIGKSCELVKNRTLSIPRIKDAVGMQALELSIYTDYLPDKILNHGVKVQELKNRPCAKYMFDHFLEWYDRDYDHKKPFYSYIHIDDIHVNPIPFSYTDDEQLLNEEFSYMKEFVDSLDDRYHGNVMYDAAIHHVDRKIQKFVNQLDQRGILDDTLLVITADHGFYYSYNHFRLDSIGNMYRENFHVPLMIYDKSFSKGSVNDGYFAQRDLPYTLLSMVGISTDPSYEGIDMRNSEGRPWVLSEYPGRGSPDLDLKQLYFGCFDAQYKVCVKAKLSEVMNLDKIVEVYDEVSDPFEGNNLVKKSYDIEHVKMLFEVIENRFHELQCENKTSS